MNNDEDQVELTIFKFTNKAESPYLDSIFGMFHHAAFSNTLGIMEAWNLESEQEELILVGVSFDENGKPDCYPLAKVLKAEDVSKYLAPNGKGGYFDPQNPREVEEYKENVNSLAEGLVQEPANEPTAEE